MPQESGTLGMKRVTMTRLMGVKRESARAGLGRAAVQTMVALTVGLGRQTRESGMGEERVMVKRDAKVLL